MCEQDDTVGNGAPDEAGFVEVGCSAQLPPGANMRVTVGETDLTLVNVDGRVVAVGDLCLRCGGSLSAARLSSGLLTCTGCGWQYDVVRGCVEGLPNLRIEMHEVRSEDGRLLVASAIAAPATVL